MGSGTSEVYDFGSFLSLITGEASMTSFTSDAGADGEADADVVGVDVKYGSAYSPRDTVDVESNALIELLDE